MTRPDSDLQAAQRAERKASLVIPTMNRSDFLARLLTYYRDIGFQGYICIGDSSDIEHLARNRDAVQKLGGDLNIIHRACPGLDITECEIELSRLVPTEYATTLMDDDFLVGGSVGRCVEFLETHPDYVAAHGVGVLFNLESDSAYGRPLGLYRYRQAIVDGETPSQRLVRHLGNYAGPLFSVHRVETWRAMWSESPGAVDRWFSEELLPSCISIIQGKVKELGCLYLVRQLHDRRAFHRHISDVVTSPSWLPSYEFLRDRVAEALVQQEDIGMTEARELVKRAFWSYLARLGVREWQAHSNGNGAGTGSYLRKAAQQSPRLWSAWQKLRWVVGGRSSELSLEALLRPSSVYHDDFMPIYRAVTGFPEASAVPR